MDGWAAQWLRYNPEGWQWPELHLEHGQWLAAQGAEVLDQIGEPTLAGRRV